MKFGFTGICQLTLEHEPGATTSKHVSTDFNLDVGKGMDPDAYLNKDGRPTQEGAKVLRNVFMQGLIGVVLKEAKEGWSSKEAGADWIRNQIEIMLEADADTVDGTFDEDNVM